jgi:hypothetical protein
MVAAGCKHDAKALRTALSGSAWASVAGQSGGRGSEYLVRVPPVNRSSAPGRARARRCGGRSEARNVPEQGPVSESRRFQTGPRRLRLLGTL